MEHKHQIEQPSSNALDKLPLDLSKKNRFNSKIHDSSLAEDISEKLASNDFKYVHKKFSRQEVERKSEKYKEDIFVSKRNRVIVAMYK